MSQDIPLSLIDAGEYRIRIHIAKISDLAANISQLGLLEPIGLLKNEERYQLLYGERRFLAAKSLGWPTIPAVVHTDKSTALLLTLTENLQREQLNPLEEARVYRRLLNTGMTQQALGKLIGKTQSYVSQKLRLEKLPFGAVMMLDPLGLCTEAHLRQLLRLEKIVKDAGMDKAPENLEVIYNAIFENTKWQIKEGKPNNGVIDMVTYYQDMIAWHSLETGPHGKTRMIPVIELARKIDAFANEWHFDGLIKGPLEGEAYGLEMESKEEAEINKRLKMERLLGRPIDQDEWDCRE